jgi:hypothetical protein
MSHKAKCPHVRVRFADETVHIRIEGSRIPQCAGFFVVVDFAIADGVRKSRRFGADSRINTPQNGGRISLFGQSAKLSKAATGNDSGFVRGVERVCLLRKHDRRESIIATSQGGIIQDDLLPTPK